MATPPPSIRGWCRPWRPSPRGACPSPASPTSRPTEPLLARCGIADYFAVTVSGDTLAEKKPHPAPLQHACRLLGVAPAAALMVGDSANDAEAARAAGMPVLLVTYGYSEGRPVDSIDCDGLLSNLEDVLRHLPA